MMVERQAGRTSTFNVHCNFRRRAHSSEHHDTGERIKALSGRRAYAVCTGRCQLRQGRMARVARTVLPVPASSWNVASEQENEH